METLSSYQGVLHRLHNYRNGKLDYFDTTYIIYIYRKYYLFLWWQSCKAEFSPVTLITSHDPSEIILMCWFAAQETHCYSFWKQLCCLIFFVETVIISHFIILSSFVLINYSECLFKTTPCAVSATWFFTHSSRDQGSQCIHERMLPLRGREGARERCRTVLIKTTPSLVGSNLKRRSKRDCVDEEYMHYSQWLYHHFVL